jgi:hypothetical protein
VSSSSTGARRRALVLVALTLALSACGGRSTPGTGLWLLGTSSEPSAPQDIFDIVPAGASYALAYDIVDADATFVRSSLHADPAIASLNAAFEEATGRTLLAEDGIEGVGIDPTGDVAIFSTSVAPVFIARLSNPGAFQSFLLDVQERNPDVLWSKLRVGGAEFLTGTRDGIAIDAAVVGRHAVARVRLGNPAWDVDDETLSAILLGEAGRGLRSDARSLALLQGEDAPLAMLAFADLRAVWEAGSAIAETGGVETEAFDDDDHRDRCERAAEKVFEAVPWIGGASVRDGDHRQRTTYLMSLSASAARSAATLLPGTFDAIGTDADDAAFFTAVNFDIQTALRAANADADLVDCPNAGAIVGLVGTLQELGSGYIEDLPFDGLAALALYDVDLGGFIPRIDAILSVGSADAIAVAELVQELLEQSGATGAVDETASHITLDYSLLGFRFRLIQTDDRVVLATGNAPVSLTSALSDSTARRPGAPFYRANLDGEDVARIFDHIAGWLQSNRPHDEDTLRTVTAVRDAYSTIGRIVATGHVEDRGLVIEVDTQLRPPGDDADAP